MLNDPHSHTFYQLARAFSATSSKKDEVEVFVDGKSVMIEQGSALIQACEKAGVDVSHQSVLLFTCHDLLTNVFVWIDSSLLLPR